MPEAVTGRRIAFVGKHVPLINGTIRDNLFYGLLQPAGAIRRTPGERTGRRGDLHLRGGAVRQHPSRIDARLDRLRRRRRSPVRRTLTARVAGSSEVVDLEPDLFALGLQGHRRHRIREHAHPAHPGRARRVLRQRLTRTAVPGPGRDLRSRALQREHVASPRTCCSACRSATASSSSGWPTTPTCSRSSTEVGLRDEFFAIGVQRRKDHDRSVPGPARRATSSSTASASSARRICPSIRRRSDGSMPAGMADAEPADRNLLSSLPFRLIPARHRLGADGR